MSDPRIGRRWRARARLAVMLAAASLLAASSPSPGAGSPVELAGPTMGTSWTVKLSTLPAGVDAAAASAEIGRVLERIDALMSTWRPDSELSRFNASDSTDWFPISTETREVVAAALEVSERTGGAFDVTVGPLVDLWGFGPPRAPDAPPDAAAIRAARERCGWRKLDLREEPAAMRKDRAGLHVDLSAIAKGYAVDRVAERIEALGVRDYLVEIGGELRARGHKPDGSAWRVAIERPIDDARVVYRALDLRDLAIATSGDYRNFYVVDGRRFSHTIDPATGRPVEHALASVSVVGESTMVADALATAIMVMGPDAGYDYAARSGVAVLLLARAPGGGFVERRTPAFAALFGRSED